MTEQIRLAAHFPGVNNTTVWSDPRSGSQIDFRSFRHLAETAERGKFDFCFLAEGLRLREMKGHIHDLDVIGRPESLTVLAALSAVTTRLGLAATVDSTFNEPYEVGIRELVIEMSARQTFVGTAASVAEQMTSFVRTGAADGFVLVPHLTPGGLDELVDEVVPLLQDKGVFRADYTGTTLRDHLGLRSPVKETS